jgi:hypothetical protein
VRHCRRSIVVFVALLTGSVVSQQPQTESLPVFHESELLKLRFTAPPRRAKALVVGPWRLGAPLRVPKIGKADKPSDKRLTLYFVVPGTQYQSAAAPSLDHNLIVNTAPAADDPLDAEFDLFWVMVLDPLLKADAKGESEIIALAQERFMPGDLYSFEDAPGAALLGEELRAESLLDLRKYRQKDGSLPRILIVPAQRILSATIER